MMKNPFDPDFQPVSVRMRADEVEQIDEMAALLGQTRSAFIRQAAMDAVRLAAEAANLLDNQNHTENS